jgi:hypothetical protein
MASENKNSVTSEGLSEPTQERVRAVRLGISLDWWAVVVAIVLAILVRLSWLNVGWFK